MKKIYILSITMLGILLMTSIFCLTSCQNQPNVFPDYPYTAVYFPIQYPVRTLVLGEDRIDNSLDKELKFNIGVSIGGLRENKKDWTVDFVMDETLATKLQASSTEPLTLLPAKYIRSMTPSAPGTITIPSGTMNGNILIQLDDTFLDDPDAYKTRYIIPLRITKTSADSILRGKPEINTPDKRVPAHWNPQALPRDFVLFAIKFINPYHGKFLHRGVDRRLDNTGKKLDSVRYHESFIERDQIWTLSTRGRNTVITNGVGPKIDANGTLKMRLTIANDGTVTISPETGSVVATNGTGKFIKAINSTEVWGGLTHDAMYLSYEYTEAGFKHVVNDTLVFRDKGLTFQSFTPVILP